MSRWAIKTSETTGRLVVYRVPGPLGILRKTYDTRAEALAEARPYNTPSQIRERQSWRRSR